VNVAQTERKIEVKTPSKVGRSDMKSNYCINVCLRCLTSIKFICCDRPTNIMPLIDKKIILIRYFCMRFKLKIANDT
jgi:hypothetical protein